MLGVLWWLYGVKMVMVAKKFNFGIYWWQVGKNRRRGKEDAVKCIKQ